MRSAGTINARGTHSLPSVQPRLEPLRSLDVPRDWEYGLSHEPVPRVFRWAGKLLLYTKPAETRYAETDPKRIPPPAELMEIDENGKDLQMVARLPARRYPLGLLDGRLLILGEPYGAEPTPLWYYDLVGRKLAPIPGDWKGYFYSAYVYVRATGGHILIYRLDKRPQSSRTYIVSLPSGKRMPVPNPDGSVVHYLWHGKTLIVGG
jgi:hypothetical protein